LGLLLDSDGFDGLLKSEISMTSADEVINISSMKIIQNICILQKLGN